MNHMYLFVLFVDNSVKPIIVLAASTFTVLTKLGSPMLQANAPKKRRRKPEASEFRIRTSSRSHGRCHAGRGLGKWFLNAPDLWMQHTLEPEQLASIVFTRVFKHIYLRSRCSIRLTAGTPRCYASRRIHNQVQRSTGTRRGALFLRANCMRKSTTAAFQYRQGLQ